MNIDRTVLVLLLLLLGTAFGAVIIFSRRRPAELAERETRFPRTAFARFSETLTIAVWFGLGTGTIHVLLALINRYVRDRLLMVGPQMFWMTPLAYALIFSVIGIAPAIFAAVRPRADLKRYAIPFFGGLSIFSLLLPFPQLHKLAGALVGAGVGLQVGRAMVPRLDWWLSVMRRTIVRGAVAVVAVAALTEAWPRAAERYATSRLPDSPRSAPNVLLIVMDTVRAQNLSLYGYPRPTTPGLEQLAREAVTFDFAMSTAPWTLKAHASMFSGLPPEEIAGDFQRPVRFRTSVLADEFRKRGYDTGGFVANLPYTTRESGLTNGFVHYDDYHLAPRQLLLHSWIAHTPVVRNLGNSRSPADLWNAIRKPALDFDFNAFNARTYGRRSAAEITDAFLDWQARGQRPFFAFLNYFDAHWPYNSPPDFRRRFAQPQDNQQGLYDGAIAHIDAEVTRLLAELRARRMLDNTIVAITSDHGEQFKDHGLDQHANSLYMQLLHVPLLIRYPPSVPGGVRVNEVVTLRDLPATLLQLAGLAGIEFPGRSLAGHWGATRATPEGSPVRAELSNVIRPEPDSPASFGPMQAIFDERFHYIRRGDGVEELFAYREDPAELSDLSATETGRQQIVLMRRMLETGQSRVTSRR